VNEAVEPRINFSRPSVLILSDDPDFARSVSARWQTERTVPEITVATSDHWRPGAPSDHDLLVIGMLRGETHPAILSALSEPLNKPAIYITSGPSETSALDSAGAHLLVVERRDGWLATLMLVGGEILRRVEVLGRAHRAERLAVESQRYAILGRYMLDMRPSVNDALTSMLGNADLLLLEPEQTGDKTREQIQTIHRMSLRLNEIMQRFSSLACEMQAGTEFDAERVSASHRTTTSPAAP
jgi:signal transduction histidine kinase